jgi:hypothetical protein
LWGKYVNISPFQTKLTRVLCFWKLFLFISNGEEDFTNDLDWHGFSSFFDTMGKVPELRKAGLHEHPLSGVIFVLSKEIHDNAAEQNQSTRGFVFKKVKIS